MLALATAIKVFPVAVFLPGLATAMGISRVSVVFLAIFLFLVPAPVRGFQHNVSN
jgi:hypothetical protein